MGWNLNTHDLLSCYTATLQQATYDQSVHGGFVYKMILHSLWYHWMVFEVWGVTR